MQQKNTLNVLFVDYIRREIGGGYFVLARLANYFAARRGSHVAPHVLINNAQEFVSRFIDDSVAWHPLNIPKSLSSVGRTASFPKLTKSCFPLASFWITFTLKVIRICKENRIHIIHANGITSLVLMALPAKILRTKLVYHLHDALLSRKDGGTIEPFAQRILLFLMRFFSDVIIVNSVFVGKTVSCKDASLSPKIRLLHNGLDINSIRQRSVKRYKGGPPLILSYGTLSARKGFQVGVEALYVLNHDFGVNARYRIIGDGPFRDNLLDLIQEKQLSNQVELIGFQDNVHTYVAEADIVLIPSVWEEPFCLVAIESMTNSKMIIASEAGGIPEVITDGKEGFLVSKNDPRQIAESVIAIMKHPEKANSIADHAYKRVQQDFTIERMALRLEHIYGSLLNTPNGEHA